VESTALTEKQRNANVVTGNLVGESIGGFDDDVSSQLEEND